MLNPNKIFSKTELSEHIYQEDNFKDSNVIEVYISIACGRFWENPGSQRFADRVTDCRRLKPGRQMYSLKKRITHNLIINMVPVMSALLVIMYFGMQQILQDYVLTRLQDDSESLISAVYQDSNNDWVVSPSQMSKFYDRVKSGHYYHLVADAQTISSRSSFRFYYA